MTRTVTLALGLALGYVLQAAAPIPRPAGEFTIVESTGKKTTVSSQKGKVVVLQFLDTGCSHCQATAGMLSKLAEDLGPRGLRVFGIAFDDSVNTTDRAKNALAAATFAARYAKFPVGMSPRDAVLKYLGISVMERLFVPQIMVIDRKGMVRAQDKPQPTGELSDETSMRRLLNTLLSEK